uniref:Microtubule-binding protein TANGLED1 n=1 Tax=Ananas comosus var. bracteatus TaxID=296719 RepID=A0A6V7QAJ9_ANACO|nr:unnamed protein product [Ananas comosus var. bracteatus]
MSLPAMLIGETVVEILQATEFAKKVVAAAAVAAATKVAGGDPKTPHTKKRSSCNPPAESTPLRSRRMREKQSLRRSARSESSAAGGSSRPSTAPASASGSSQTPPRPSVAANRVSPRNRPWARKAVLFPNPLFLPNSSTSPSSSSHKQRFYKTRSPIIGTTAAARRKKEFQQTPHRFAIKSPPGKSLQSHLASKKAVPAATLRSPPLRARRCSFSPSKLASRLVSPLRTRMMVAVRRSSEGLKQRPIFSTP